MNNDIENHMVLPQAAPDDHQTTEPDPDMAYEMMKADELDAQREADIDERNWLILEIDMAIQHLTKHNWFDKQNLVALLKRIRNYLDE